MEKKSWQKLHTVLMVKVGQFLKEENPNDDIKTEGRTTDRPKIKGRDGRDIYPDLINYTKKIAYEVHVEGERKERQFDNLPDGWRAVNIFYDEEQCPETIVIKEQSHKIQKVAW